MLARDDQAAWTRLGLLLEQRRVEMDVRYRNRVRFCAERGIDYRLTYDIESGARKNYRRPTRRAIEVAYGLEAGAIDAVLAGATRLPALPRREPPAADPVPPAPAQRGLTPEQERIAREFVDAIEQDQAGHGHKKAANGA